MTEVETLECPRCGATDESRAGDPGLPGGRIWQCHACEWIHARRRPQPAKARPVALQVVRRIAPNGVLRDRYRIFDVLGEGAHGVSFLARHEYLNHPCVVKILPHSVSSSTDSAVRRLRNEARAGYRVNHPNVVRVLDCDVVSGVWYFVMEFVDGVDLDALIGAGVRVLPPQAMRILRDAADGLEAVHAAGLVHRDVKPGNLLLGHDGRLRIADLGVVGFSEGETVADETTRLSAAGTLDYMAPEVLSIDTQVDSRADIYSLGATMFELLTGHPPHRASGLLGTLVDVQSRRAEWPADARPDVPRWLVETILRCLATEPDGRFRNAGELKAALAGGGDSTGGASPRVLPAMMPRGLAVLPFDNLDGGPENEWLGFAVAEYLGNQLAQIRDVYVADHEQVLKVIDDLSDEERHGGDRLARACRLVGAATVVGGEFRRQGEQIVLSSTLQKADEPLPVNVATVSGAMSDLAGLQAALLDALRGALGLKSRETAAGAARTVPAISIGAREKYVDARKAHLKGDYRRAIAIAQEIVAADPQFVEAVGFIGACHARLGEYARAEEFHRQLEESAHRRGDRRLLVEAHANLGTMYFFKGEYDAAHGFYAQASGAAGDLGLVAELAQINNNLGFVLMRLHRLEEAAAAFQRAIETHEAYGAAVSLIAPYNGMGSVMMELGRLDDAREFYEKALELAHNIGDRAKVGVSHMNLARCAAMQKDFAAAKLEFASCFNALEETSFWNGLTRAYEYVADMNLDLGQYEEAARCADRRIQLARIHENRSMEAAAWRQKAIASERFGRTAEAQDCRVQAERLAAGGERAAGDDGRGAR